MNKGEIKSNEIINVHVVLSWRTLDYFKYQVENFRHLAHNFKRVFFFIYALDYETHTYCLSCEFVSHSFPIYKKNWAYRKNTLHEIKIWMKWLLFRKSQMQGSNGHAAGLTGFQKSVSHLKGHHIIADVDTVMLQKNWDKKILELFESYDLIGAPYEPIGGFSSGSTKVQTYKNFPTAVWVAMRDGFCWENVSWWPDKKLNILIDSQEKEKVFGLPIGYELVRDVGWELCQFAYDNDLVIKSFDHVKPSSAHVLALLNASDYNEEYQLDGVAFMAHQRGSSQNPYRQTDLSRAFFNDVEAVTGQPTTLSWPSSEKLKLRRFYKLYRLLFKNTRSHFLK